MSPKPSKLHESWPNALICAGSTSDDHPLPVSGDVDEPIWIQFQKKIMHQIPPRSRQPNRQVISSCMSRKIEKEVVLHRRRGHIPFDSRCDHCVRSRSVVRRSRSHPGRSPIDFMSGCRFLVLADAGTGLVGVAAVDGQADRTQSDCLAFFKQLAVTEASPVVVEVLTDSDAMLGNLLRRLGLPLQVKTVGPQARETVGLAERNVRRFKEMVSCLRSDLRAHRFDLTCSGECLRWTNSKWARHLLSMSQRHCPTNLELESSVHDGCSRPRRLMERSINVVHDVLSRRSHLDLSPRAA